MVKCMAAIKPSAFQVVCWRFSHIRQLPKGERECRRSDSVCDSVSLSECNCPAGCQFVTSTSYDFNGYDLGCASRCIHTCDAFQKAAQVFGILKCYCNNKGKHCVCRSMPAVTGITLKKCESNCAANVLCRAFTYNGNTQRKLFASSGCIHDRSHRIHIRISPERVLACHAVDDVKNKRTAN